MPRRRENLNDEELKLWMETQYDFNENGCWVWKKSKNRDGYGNIGYRGSVSQVHRLYWVLSGRIIPEGLELRHGNGCPTACFNPEHLTPGTKSENGIDMHRDGTMFRAKLTTEQVLSIRSRTDKTRKELAEEYGITKQHLDAILSRRAWVWLS
jgi:hypothetical protein